MSIELTVKALSADASGYGIIVVSGGVLDRLETSVDGFVGVSADGTTIQRAIREATSSDDSIVGLDEQSRERLGVEVDDTVTITPLSPPHAHRIKVRSHDPPDDIDPYDLELRLSHRLLASGETLHVDLSNETTTDASHVTVNVEDTIPNGTVGTRRSTVIEFVGPLSSTNDSQLRSDSEDSDADISYDSVGGQDAVLRKIREVVELPLAHPGTVEEMGAVPPTGVLLHGPPGTGKTRIARAVANEADATFLRLDASAVFSKWVGETEDNIREVFDEARRKAPTIVYIDEIDAVAGKRSDGKSWEARAVTELLTQLDGLDKDEDVVTIASTNRIDTLDPALRRPGRFDREIEVGRPDREGRLEILQIHARGVPLAPSVDFETLADQTIGYTGADLAALISEAVTAAISRVHGFGATGESDSDHGISTQIDSSSRVTADDIQVGLESTAPNGLREHAIEMPETSWGDVGGLDDAKDWLKRHVVWPQTHVSLYDAVDLETSAGVLLHGPPGTGKTLLARAAATETDATVLPVPAPELTGSQPGETETAIHNLFERARSHAPCVIIIDELDAVAPVRDSSPNGGSMTRIVGQLLTELDGIRSTEDVVVIGTTNRPECIDEALTRPGRLGASLHVGLPTAQERQSILAVHLRDRPVADDVDLAQLASRTDGYTGADLEALCRQAARNAVHRMMHGDVGDQTPDEAAVRLTSADFTAALGTTAFDDVIESSDHEGRAFN